MRALTTLIRLQRRQLDELRRSMTDFERQREQLLSASAKLASELEEEVRLAAMQPEMSQFFGDFAQRIRKRQESIASEVASVQTQMQQLAEKIHETYGDLKKYEIARDQFLARKREAENRAETIQMDEIALEQHRRKENG